MRLEILESGHRPLQKLQLAIVRAFFGHVPGPMLVMSYRRRWFGLHFARCLQEAMREATAWTAGECELFAAFVSKKNRCEY